MDGMLALTIVCVVFAIGDFISDKTHAIIPVLLFASVTFLILFWTVEKNLPEEQRAIKERSKK